jgi:hypothetical protein
MTNSEFLEEMLIHIHTSNLNRDFNKKIKKLNEENPKMEYLEKVELIYHNYKQEGLIK